MCHLVVEVYLYLEGERVLIEIVVVWVVKVDGVPLLVERMTILDVVKWVPIKDVVTHTIVEGVSVELVVSHIVHIPKSENAKVEARKDALLTKCAKG